MCWCRRRVYFVQGKGMRRDERQGISTDKTRESRKAVQGQAVHNEAQRRGTCRKLHLSTLSLCWIVSQMCLQ